MNILILSASTGGGHLKASKALESYILENELDAKIKVVDTLEYVNPFINKIVTKGYIVLAKYLNLLYKNLYSLTDKSGILTCLVTRLIFLFSKKLLPLIEEFAPDVIITSHPFPTEMISILKGNKSIKVPSICIMTDYAPHNTWIKPNVDEYCVACEDMIEGMIDRGVAPEKVHPYGIPVYSGFFHQDEEDKKILLDELGLSENKMTLLVMAGSFGVYNIEKIYKNISNIPMDFQIIILTGNNKRLYNKIKEQIKFSNKQTKLIKFTNEVHRYMNLADVLITKPGGLTVSEALAANLPLITFDAIPGQEEANAKFLLDHGMSISIGSGDNCIEAIEALLKDKNKLKEIKENCMTFDKSNSTIELLELIRRLIKENEAESNSEIA
ncbi:glycosyltransferase [Clostridium sp.]|uniref:MGDG synthase family glycosyltransferase n=1 Tax=Clostridium sp. TaxID=1506 RepID=UPI003464B40E